MLCPERGLKTATFNPIFAKPLAKAVDKTVFPEESWKRPKIKIDRKPQQPLLGCFLHFLTYSVRSNKPPVYGNKLAAYKDKG
jgi:hypothetical protein